MTNTAKIAQTATTDLHPCACGGVTFRSFGKDETRVCTATTKRTFAPGHDAKLKGELIRRELAGDLVVLASGEVVSPTYFASRFGFADMVAAGVRNFGERAAAKAAKKAARSGKAAQRIVERKLAEKAAKTAPETVTAKVGRWVYEGTVADSPAEGPQFTYTDKKGISQTTTKFTRV